MNTTSISTLRGLKPATRDAFFDQRSTTPGLDSDHRRLAGPSHTSGGATNQGWRYEWKYVMPRPVRAAWVADLRAFTDPDPHAGAGGCYTVRSLYLDTLDRASFTDKVDGLPIRRKLRVRAYLEGAEHPRVIKFEVKHRQGERIRKDVSSVTVAEYRKLWKLLDSPSLLPELDLGRATAMAAFWRWKQTMGMRPMVNIEFQRQAFVLHRESDCRITLDDGLTGWRSNDLLDRRFPPGHAVDRWNTVLEIKLTSHMPFWLNRLLSKYHLQRTSVSKYAHVVANQLGT